MSDYQYIDIIILTIFKTYVVCSGVNCFLTGFDLTEYQLLSFNFRHIVGMLTLQCSNYVFVVPVAQELDLKKAAKAVGEKSIAMIKSKELLPLTGYIHGGCSPIGVKKQFTTTVHNTASSFNTIIFSAGKIGYQVELSLEELKKVIRITEADIIC